MKFCKGLWYSPLFLNYPVNGKVTGIFKYAATHITVFIDGTKYGFDDTCTYYRIISQKKKQILINQLFKKLWQKVNNHQK